MKLSWINSTSLKEGYRMIKSSITKGLVNTTKVSHPFGFDSNPTENYMAIIAETQSNDEPVIVGYLNPRAIEALSPGDSALYSTDANGNIIASIVMRNNGTAELLGTGDNAVRFAPLDSGLQDFKTGIQQELTKIQVAIAGVGGAYTPGTLTVDINGAKIDEIKTTPEPTEEE